MSTETQPAYLAQPKQRVIILCHSKLRCHDFRIIADACNCITTETDWRLGQRTDVEAQPAADFLLVELLSISEEPAQSLSELARYLQQNASQILLWTDMALLEMAYATLPVDRSHFLVNANDGDAMPILSGALKKMATDQLHDQSRKNDYRALHRISDELALFARTLAQMAEGKGDGKMRIADKPVSFRPAPPDAFRELITGKAGLESKVTAASVRQIIKLRRLRESYFDASLFADPAWDILLDLFAAELEEKTVSVSSLCIAASVPPTTALRWIGEMTENGLLVRRLDPSDGRRVFISLSARASTQIKLYFSAMRDNATLV